MSLWELLQRGPASGMCWAAVCTLVAFIADRNKADGPSRDRPVDPPSGAPPSWLVALQQGDSSGFDEMVACAQ